MNILTVTMNPAIDQTVKVNELVLGQVIRAESSFSNAGGKGVNVASCLSDWGVSVSASGVLGSNNEFVFNKLMSDKRILDFFYRVDGDTRVNIKIVDKDDTTDINLPGIAITQDIIQNVNKKIDAAILAEKPSIAAISGSLPPGCPVTFYAELIKKINSAGIKSIFDTSGAPLKACVDAGVMPYCIKPNKSELSDLCGSKLISQEDVIREAKNLLNRGVGLVVVSMGEEGGLFISKDIILHALGKVDHLESTVGAGDAMVAGIAAALAENADIERIARLSSAFSTSKLSLQGPNLPAKNRVEDKAKTIMVATV